jgi:hypothetical protein
VKITKEMIRAKFGDDYVATERTFRLGIGKFFSYHIAERFQDKRVLETCTGGGFCTISLARVAEHVVTVEVDPDHQLQAAENIERAGLGAKVTFISGDILSGDVLKRCGNFDAAFLDPDWAIAGTDHVYRFKNSNTRPPSDLLLASLLGRCDSVALVLPASVDQEELDGLPQHELETLYLDGMPELVCLYFGPLMHSPGLATSWYATAPR